MPVHLEFQTPDHPLPSSYVQPQASQFLVAQQQQIKLQVKIFLISRYIYKFLYVCFLCVCVFIHDLLILV